MNISTIVRKWVRKTYMYLCYLTRSRTEKSVYFASFRGQYSDNPRAISECLHKIAPDVKIVWLVKPQFFKYVPDYVTIVPPKPRLALKAQAQANTDTTQLFEAMSVAGPICKTVGWDIKDLATITDVFGNAGISGDGADNDAVTVFHGIQKDDDAFIGHCLLYGFRLPKVK